MLLPGISPAISSHITSKLNQTWIKLKGKFVRSGSSLHGRYGSEAPESRTLIRLINSDNPYSSFQYIALGLPASHASG